MARGDGTYAPTDGQQMSARQARAIAKEICYRNPVLHAEAWAIAQGLAYVKVDGPTTRGVIDLVLQTRREAETFLELLR